MSDGATWDPSGREPQPKPRSDRSITPEADGRYRPSKDVPPDVPVEPEELGRGGIGRVVVMWDGHLGREVARKEILGGPGGSLGTTAARFLREARVTARLEHPNIVPVYELGEGADGRLYYTMKRVRGRTLHDALRERGDVRERLALLDHFVDLCNAIAYAHDHGVVHRDIKPQNVMIGEFGETIVLDWGLAKVRGQEDVRGSDLAKAVDALQEAGAHQKTLQGTTMGTPAYMSPEQAHGDIAAIDERSDVWSLGAVLFEILAGDPPFTGASPLSVLQDVREAPPPRVRERAHDAPPELAAIADKCLERDPSDRYPSAQALADDVRAYQSGRRVQAYAYSHGERLHRVAWRYRAVLGVAAIALVAVSGVGVAAWRSMRHERDVARQAEKRAQDQGEQASAQYAEALANAAVGALDPDHGEGAGAAELLASASLVLEETPEARGALIAARSGTVPRLRWIADAGCARAATSPVDSRVACIGPERLLIWQTDGGAPDQKDGSGEAIAWMHDGSAIVTGGAKLVITGTNGRQTVVPVPSPVTAVATTADGRVVTGEDARAPAVRVRGADGSELSALTGHAGAITAVAATGGLVASGSADHTTRLWDVSKGTSTVLPAPAEGSLALAFSPDGRTLATAGDPNGGDGAVHLWNVATSSVVATLAGATGDVVSVAFSGDGALVASGSTDGTARLWRSDGVPLAVVAVPEHEIRSVSLSHDGDQGVLLVAVDDDGVVRAWSFDEKPDRLVGHTRSVDDVAWTEDGRLVTAGEDGTVRVWAGGDELRSVLVDPLGVRALALLPGDGAALVGDARGQLSTVDLQTASIVSTRPVLEGAIWSLALSPDGHGFAAAGDDAHVHIGPIAGGAIAAAAMDPQVTRVAWIDEGQHVLFAHRRVGWLLEADGRDGRPAARAQGDTHGLVTVAVSPDGHTVATGGDVVRLWDADPLKARKELARGIGRTDDVAWSPDGALLATAGADRVVRVWDVASEALLAAIPGHTNRVTRLAFSPDGRTLASAGADRVVRLWDLQTLHIPASDALLAAARETGLTVDGATVKPDPEWKP